MILKVILIILVVIIVLSIIACGFIVWIFHDEWNRWEQQKIDEEVDKIRN